MSDPVNKSLLIVYNIVRSLNALPSNISLRKDLCLWLWRIRPSNSYQLADHKVLLGESLLPSS